MTNFTPETILGRFRLEERLLSSNSGEGLWESYRAFDLRSSKPVCLKLIPPEAASNAHLIRRLQRETGALQSLSHPNLAGLIGFFQLPDRAALVRQWVEGVTLADVLAAQGGNPLPQADVLAYLNALSSVIGYAHENGVIHANLAPSNVLIDSQGQIFLADFNLLPAAALAPSPFRPPEATGERAASGLRPAVDVFALGALLYTLVTGRTPPAGRVPDPRRVNAALSPSVALLVTWACDPQPEQRPQSARAFFNAACQAVGIEPEAAPTRASLIPGVPEWLEQTAATMPMTVSPAGGGLKPAPQNSTAATMPMTVGSTQPSTGHIPPSGEIPHPPLGEHSPYGGPSSIYNPQSTIIKWLLAFLGGVLLISILALIALNGMANTPLAVAPSPTAIILVTPTPTSPPTATPDVPSPTPTSNLPSATPAPSATFAPTPNTPPFIAYAKGSVGASDLYLADQDGKNGRLFVAQAGCDESEPALSPDEQYLVFQRKCSGDSYDIWKVAVNNGTPIQLTSDAANDEREPTWGPDGSVIYRVNPTGRSADQDGELWIMNNDGSDARTLAVMGRGPAISPDGRFVAFMSKRGGIWQIYIYEFSSGKTTQITSGENCRWPAWSPDSQQVAYNTADAGNNALGLYIVPVGGGDARLVTEDGAGRPGWSSNGLIAFNTTRGIEVIRADGSNRRVLIGEVQAWSPAWSR